jgi:dTDP-4-amino-4,6-dideoxygalactose transaminase
MTGWAGVWAPLPLPVWVRRAVDPPPFPLDVPGWRLYEEGRDAVWHGVRALGLGSGDEVLSPAYHAGPDVEAMLRAGMEVRFYAGNDRLEPDSAELEGLVTPRTRALYLVHYLGFPQDAALWRAWCDERGLLLIEDAAQAWLSTRDGVPVGSFGDLALWSVYKMVPTPDGAVAICREPLSNGSGPAGIPLGKLVHMHGAWLGQRWGVLRRLRGGGETEEEFDWDDHFALGDPDAPVARTTRYLMRRLGDESVAEARRENYRVLLDSLADHVPGPFDQLPDGASPWFFPVESDDRDGMSEHLAERGVGAMAVWSEAHPALDPAAFPEAARRRQVTLALPVHDQLRAGDVDRIAAAATDWYRG